MRKDGVASQRHAPRAARGLRAPGPFGASVYGRGGLCRLRAGGGFSGSFISTIDREAGPIIYFIFMVGSSEVKTGERGWT